MFEQRADDYNDRIRGGHMHRTPDGVLWSYERGEWFATAWPAEPAPSRAEAWTSQWTDWLDGRSRAARAAYYPTGGDLERYDPNVVTDAEWWDDPKPPINVARVAGYALLIIAAICLLLAGQGAVAPIGP